MEQQNTTQFLLKDYNDVLTFKELQEILNFSRTKTYKLLQAKIIPVLKVGSNYRILKQSVIDILNSNLK